MTQQPSDDAIAQLCMLTDIPRDEAIRRLQGNNNNAEAALNEFFDDPNSTKYKWEETAFTSDRDGATNNAGISFQVHGPDQMDQGGWEGNYSSAPSRPPSRTSNNSPYGAVISLAAEHAAADPRTRLTQDEAGDHDLQRALALSAEESGTQQMGIIDEPMPYGQIFGPANRPSYDDDQWAMVRGNSYAQEVLPDPDPADRKRKADEPAFLRPSIKETRLASILTIYHEIPLARQVLMNPDNLATDYGYDAEWWTGKQIGLPSPNWTGETSWDVASPQDVDDFMREIQRLMAFLTGTERAYGSVDALVNMPALTIQGAADAEIQFFEAWCDACRRSNQEHPIPLLFTTAVQPDAGRPALQEKHFAILDLEIPHPDNVEDEKDTIYDLADAALWEMSGFEVEESAYLDTLAEVVAFRLVSRAANNTDSRVRIPATWYPDRYLKVNREEALKMRQKQAEIKAEIENIRLKERKLTHFRLSPGKTVKVKNLFAASMRHDANLIENSQQDGEGDHYHGNASNKSPVNISEELKKLMKSIDSKLQQLEEEKNRARASLRELSKLYTEVSTNHDGPPTHKYTLRGVSVSKFVTYVRRRAEPNLISMDDGDMDGLEQWWMIEYSTSSAQPVNVKKVTEDEVLTEAYGESRNCTVVYASEKAMAYRDSRLPEALEKFVQADNLAFKAELAKTQETSNEHEEFASPRSPKRKFGESMEQGDNVPGPPPGPPPDYSPPSNKQFSGVEEKSSIARFPSPPTYSVVDERGVQGKESTATESSEKAGEGAREMVEMQTKGNVPRLISTMSMDSKEKHDDAMDVDDLGSPRLEKQ